MFMEKSAGHQLGSWYVALKCRMTSLLFDFFFTTISFISFVLLSCASVRLQTVLLDM